MKCIMCSNNTRSIYNLGSIAISNALGSKERYPLGLVFCETCFNVQLDYQIDLQVNFKDYNYRSSIAVEDSLIKEIMNAGLTAVPTPRKILEIASNDGYLLRAYKNLLRQVIVVGVDPAANLLIHNRGIPVYSDFFSEEVAEEIANDYTSFDLIHAHNVLAHVEDPCSLIRGIAKLCSPSTVVICDVQYLGATLKKSQFDNIYHEHFSYYSLTTLDKAFSMNGLYIYDAEIIESQGGTLRVYARMLANHHAKGSPPHTKTSRAKVILNAEMGTLDNLDYIKSAMKKIGKLLQNFQRNTLSLRERGPIFGYGAGGKCNVVLNLANIEYPLITGVFDDADVKIGNDIPGSSIPILDPQTINTWDIGSIIVFPWNVMDKIVAKYPDIEDRFISSRELLCNEHI